MGVSTDGQLCFGIAFEEEFMFPWTRDDDDEYEFEDWWREQRGWTQQWSDGDETFFARRREFDKEHPAPVECVLHCSFDYPMYILALPGTSKSASRGYPTAIEVELTPLDDAAILKFCADSGIEMNDDQRGAWLLSSLWG